MTVSAEDMAVLLTCVYIVVSRALVPLGLLSGVIQFGTLMLSLLATLYMDRGEVRLVRFLWMELCFIAITFVIGVLVASNKTLLLDSILTMIFGLCFGYSFIRISIKKRSIDWFIKAWIAAGVIMASYVLVSGGYLTGRILIRITGKEGMNANTLGVFMMFTIWCILYLISESMRKGGSALKNLLLGVLLVGACLYVLLGTGSRKALIACAFLISCWLIFAILPLLRRYSLQRRILLAVVAFSVVAVLIYRYGDRFSSVSQTMKARMELLSGESFADNHRTELIKDAIRVFKDHIFFGVGWNNYKLQSIYFQYSHCTYVEVLACTGLVGGVLAYYMFILMGQGVVKYFRLCSNVITKANYVSLVAVFVFINSVQIMYYNSYLLMIMHLIVSIPIVKELEPEETLNVLQGEK